LDIGRATGGGNPSTTGSADDTASKDEIMFTAGSYAEPVAKTFIAAGYSGKMDPIGHELALIRITANYLKTVGEDSSGELTFCSSAFWLYINSMYCF
jgi:hypothetical protein